MYVASGLEVFSHPCISDTAKCINLPSPKEIQGDSLVAIPGLFRRGISRSGFYTPAPYLGIKLDYNFGLAPDSSRDWDITI